MRVPEVARLRLPRRDPVPRHVRHEVLAGLLGDGERLAAVARLDVPGELWLAATDLALLAPGPGGWERLPWESLDKVVYDGRTLRVTEAGSDRERRYPVVEAAALARVVRARVERSIAWSQHHRLESVAKGGVLVVARREPDGTLRWSLSFDAEVDAGDPGVAAEAAELLRAARAGAGG